MPSTDKTPDNTVKLSMRIDSPLWEAWSVLAKRAGYDPVDYIKVTMIETVTEAAPPVLEPEEKAHLQRLARLNRKVVEIATKMFATEPFSADITLRVFRQAMQDQKFLDDYTAHIGGKDPYVHGNPRKDVNRELGWRIKNALPVEVVKADGKPVEQRNLKGEVIQSYTLLKLLDNDVQKAA